MEYNPNDDKAIEYHAAYDLLNESLEKVKKIEFDTSKIEKEMIKIDNTLNKEIKNVYKLFENNKEINFFSDSLKQAYENATKKINKLTQYLINEYNEYYIIYNEMNDLSNHLKYISSNNIYEYTKRAKNLTKSIRESSQIDYTLEKKLVEKVYEIAYQILKLECIYNTSSTLLDNLNENNADIQYITKLIEKDISKVTTDHPQYEEIQQIISKINKQGLNASLLNKELITLLVYANDKDIISKKTEAFIENCNTALSIYEEIDELANKKRIYKSNITVYTENIKENKKNKLKGNIILVGNFAAAAISAFGLYHLTQYLTTETLYKTVIESYDSSKENPYQKEEEYQKERKDSIIITEYTPWIEPGYFRKNYTREVYTYDISNANFIANNIEDYLTSDLIDVEEIEITNENETSSNIPENLYTNNIYQINKTVQDKNDTKPQEHPLMFKIALGAEYTLLGILEIVLLAKNRKKRMNLKISTQQLKQSLKEAKEILLEKKDSYDKLIQQFNKLDKDLRVEYEQLPESIRKKDYIKYKILELKQLPPINNED